SQQSTRNIGKAIVTSSAPTYDTEPATVTKDEEMASDHVSFDPGPQCSTTVLEQDSLSPEVHKVKKMFLKLLRQ
ncbi:hypothetical protein Tco_0506996, partial [Tanacetum coccineum]